MSASTLLVRFALIYWVGLFVLVAGLHRAGTESGTAENFLVYVCALYVATRGWRPAMAPRNENTFLITVLAGIAACDGVGQLGFMSHLSSPHRQTELWRALPFVAASTVAAQTAFAFFFLRRVLRQQGAPAGGG